MLAGTLSLKSLTSFLHERKKIVQEFLPFWIVINFIELKIKERKTVNKSKPNFCVVNYQHLILAILTIIV